MSASPCRTQVQSAALFLVYSLIFIEYYFSLYLHKNKKPSEDDFS